MDPVVIVTGAAGGIGLEIVRYLLEELKGRVVAVDIVRGGLDAMAEANPDRLEVILGDISAEETSAKSVSQAVSRFGRLTGLCLNAGTMGPMDRLYDSDPAKWTKAFQVNVLSHLYTFKYAIPHLRQTEGKVVFTTSDAGRAVFPGWGFYSMSKTAVAFEVQQLHLEEPSLIAIGLRPGLCDTPMLRGVMDGTYEGWSQEDAAAFKNISAGHELIPPKVAAKGFAYAVAKASRALSGFVYDWNDPQIQTLIG